VTGLVAEENETKPVNDRSKFCSLFTSQLTRHLSSAEILLRRDSYSK